MFYLPHTHLTLKTYKNMCPCSQSATQYKENCEKKTNFLCRARAGSGCAAHTKSLCTTFEFSFKYCTSIYMEKIKNRAKNFARHLDGYKVKYAGKC